MPFFFVEDPLRRLGQGRLLHAVFAWALRGVAALAVLGALWQFFKLFDVYQFLEFGEKIAYFVFANLFTLGAALLVFQVLWVRSADILRDEQTDYPALAIFRLLAKAGGEAWAVLTAAGGVSTMVLVWLKLYPCQLAGYLPSLGLHADEPFWAGLMALAAGLVGAAAALFAAYFASELVTALADIARHTRRCGPGAGN